MLRQQTLPPRSWRQLCLGGLRRRLCNGRNPSRDGLCRVAAAQANLTDLICSRLANAACISRPKTAVTTLHELVLAEAQPAAACKLACFKCATNPANCVFSTRATVGLWQCPWFTVRLSAVAMHIPWHAVRVKPCCPALSCMGVYGHKKQFHPLGGTGML